MINDAILCALGAVLALLLEHARLRLIRRRLLNDEAVARLLHTAMMDAPHDGADFRMARAALRFFVGWL